VSPDYRKTFFADVFNSGKVLEYYAEKWHQKSEELSALIDKMVSEFFDRSLTEWIMPTSKNWFDRLTVEEVLIKCNNNRQQ
jgi:hypothetical protein